MSAIEIVFLFGLIAIFLLMIRKSDTIFPILYLFAFTYYVQYLYTPYLIYDQYPAIRAQMAISSEKYFGYIYPALGCLFAGVFLFNREVPIGDGVKSIKGEEAARYGYLLLSVSIFFDLISWAGIDYFESIRSFTEVLRYLAAFCFIFTRSWFNYLLIAAIYLQLTYEVLRSGVFISLFIWGLYLLLVIFLRFRISYWLRVLILASLIPLVFLIQGVKNEYRDRVWKDEDTGGIGLLQDLAQRTNDEEEDLAYGQSTPVVRTVARLNQAWHLGMTIRQVPARQKFVDGEEMLADMAGAVIPRVLINDKRIVNSRDKFIRFTGHKLRGNTSMSIGVVGDFYVNYGRIGSFIGLFIFGALVAYLLRTFTGRVVSSDPIQFVWIPFMFNYLIRANNDFYMFFNCLVKGFLIFIFIQYLRRQLWPADGSAEAAA